VRKYANKNRMCSGKKMRTNRRESRSARHQLRVQGCCLPFISRIYSRRSYMGRCSLPISPRRPFALPPPCASNKHNDQENRLSLVRNRLVLCARIRLHAECTARADSGCRSRSTLRASSGSRECDKRQETGPRPGTSNKIADQ